MSVRSSIIALLAGLSVALGATAEPMSGGGPAGPTGQPGTWRNQKIELVYMGFTSRYSCDGLESKLELLLRQLGARPDFKVSSYGCDRGYGVPSHFPGARLEFATLQPADGSTDATAVSEPAVAGGWRSVELSPNHPFDLQDGDCELMEQFRDKILPLFATRELQARTTCIPHQDSGGPFDLQMQVFAPLTPKKSGAQSK